MKKKIRIILSLFVLIFVFMTTASYAKNYQFEKKFLDIGYEEVNKAVEKSKKHFKQEIALPLQIPPITFTHNFGRFNNSEGSDNDSLEIKYINKNTGENHYQIQVRPIDFKVKFEGEKIDRTLKLNDGNDAIYSTAVTGFNILTFDKNGLQYILSLDKKVSDNALEILMEIANSIS
ncbi:hypothetical protein CSE16_12915 [Solibacillus sp. R5-41]|uniref:hypothetical protein n=1 Tax=Solibacillus sp. R5-41 TaxID=2048654 RepID=UPI000C126D48|nr:hypothetical protein [Solibacillus sp. R5-41]ATP40873.1 hypothetical protein CSE16_12915 [Solibacillus sp. R5-41]